MYLLLSFLLRCNCNLSNKHLIHMNIQTKKPWPWPWLYLTKNMLRWNWKRIFFFNFNNDLLINLVIIDQYLSLQRKKKKIQIRAALILEWIESSATEWQKDSIHSCRPALKTKRQTKFLTRNVKVGKKLKKKKHFFKISQRFRFINNR